MSDEDPNAPEPVAVDQQAHPAISESEAAAEPDAQALVETAKAAIAAAAEPGPPREPPPGHVTVNIMRPFTLTLQDGTQRRFAAGMNEIPEELARHWFVQHHTDTPPSVELVPGMPEFLAQKQREAATEAVIEAAIEQADAGLKETIRGALRKRRQHQA